MTLYDDPQLKDAARELGLRRHKKPPRSRAEQFRQRRVSPLGHIQTD